MINKKNIISTVVLIGSISIGCLTTYSVKGNADEETLQMVKEQLQQQINDKTDELEDKDKKIEELNQKVNEQEDTINNLNNTVNNLSDSVKDTKEDLNTAKQVQKNDKKEVISYADTGDERLQKQINDINSNTGENRVIPAPSNGGDAYCNDDKSNSGSGNGTGIKIRD